MPDYAFYRGAYFGEAIQESAFPALAGKAKAQLDGYLRRFPGTVCDADCQKMAICAMAEVLHAHERRRSAETVGKVTVRYAENKEPLGKKLYRAAAVYLDFYRGVGGWM